MMHSLLVFMMYLPFWLIGMAAITLQLAIHFNRKQNSIQKVFWVVTALMVASAIMSIYFRLEHVPVKFVKAWFTVLS